ncbi:MAG TPA: hypothetical protein VJY39_04155, partial [Acidisphaera sp.]|nr:hypothetical protein [Acidisphaera sp.]
MLRWLPNSLQRLYRRLIDAVPYARKTRPRPLPPDDERPSSGQARHYRLEIAYDAFCEHRPPPKKVIGAEPRAASRSGGLAAAADEVGEAGHRRGAGGTEPGAEIVPEREA